MMCQEDKGLPSSFQTLKKKYLILFTGETLRTVKFPVTNITSCCFGGPNYEDLYVTSSSFRIKPEKLRDQPLAGSVFIVKGLGVKGLPANVYDDYPRGRL